MKSEKENTLTPFLVVSNCSDALEFYCSALGAEELVRHNMPDGRITAKIAINGSEVWVGDEEPEFNNLSPKTIGGTGVRIILTDYDPDTIFTKAMAKGATQICP